MEVLLSAGITTFNPYITGLCLVLFAGVVVTMESESELPGSSVGVDVQGGAR